eukprot:scaffold3308_cov42-Cyclotella_meneghiniana.AAC.1
MGKEEDKEMNQNQRYYQNSNQSAFEESLARSELKLGELHKLSLLVDLSYALFSAILERFTCSPPAAASSPHRPTDHHPSWPAASK